LNLNLNLNLNLDLNCESQDAGAINEFGANLTRLIEGSLLTQKQHAVFLDSCHHHCGEWDMIWCVWMPQHSFFTCNFLRCLMH
jgi:hypothetical protein